jgi:hypothetical protein
MNLRRQVFALGFVSPFLLASLVAGCGDDAAEGTPNAAGAAGTSPSGGAGGTGGTGTAGTTGGAGESAGGTGGTTVDDPPPPFDPQSGPAAGNPAGACSIPAEAGLADSSQPTTVVGDGTAASCTSAAVVAAVAKGGVITFSCGPDPLTIVLTETAKIVNDTGPDIVIDGGGKITLSGGGKRRILYQNTCDQNQKWTTSHCQDQDHPRLVVQNLTFVDGNATGQTEEGGGGGAVLVRGGRVRFVNTRFFRNQCDETGPDLGGAAVRVLSQSEGKPVYVVGSTFGGQEGFGNRCSNGAGLSSIGVSYTVINSLFSHNAAIGNGANPAKNGTPGGGSGGAIYNDGNTFTLSLCGDLIENNTANEGGGAIFFVSNDRSGTLSIKDSVLKGNPSKGFETKGYPGIFYLGKGDPQVSGSTLE